MKILIDKILDKIAEDEATQTHYLTEVTQDFASTNAELRLRAFREVLALIAQRERELSNQGQAPQST